ncbi:Fur family transcriptional regulator [Allohahella marinimesophila]|uniref:Transcriptional repressor n=1 Tax=Allohahella marinimesophila TaxID=1054972 RepID=A0ABP7NSN5_9GAMM
MKHAEHGKIIGLSIAKAIDSAEASCSKAGIRLTEKRKNVLKTLLASDTALSAYDIVDEYRAEFQDSIPVMSVYRMLEVLAHENLVHKLASVNKYVACAHISCDHNHEIPQFLICDQCETVREIGVRKDIIESLQDSVSNSGFMLTSQQMELHGRCSDCQQAVEST